MSERRLDKIVPGGINDRFGLDNVIGAAAYPLVAAEVFPGWFRHPVQEV